MIAFELIMFAFSACLEWFNELISESGYLSYFLGMIIISIVFDKIIRPMLRGSGSDRADPRRNKKEEE